MSDPQRPGEPSRPPIADAAALFDSNEVHTLNPAPPTTPPPPAEDPASEYDLDALASNAVSPTAVRPPTPPRPAPPRSPSADRPRTKPDSAGANRNFDPSSDDDPTEVIPASGRRSSQGSPSDSAARRSRLDLDAEPDSSDRVPNRPRKRKSERAIGFDDDDGDDATVEDESAVMVDPVWTRGAEWGPDLVRVGLALAATLVIAYFALGISFGTAVLVVLLGGAATVLLSYPVLVTIERPVRMTPEQAVTDFFEAAGHHLPHYRRMWLLLSPTARGAGRFSSFGEFRSHWENRMAGWKAGKGRFTPLDFRVVDFQGQKSVGQTATRVEYTVQVFVRGQETGRPLASAAMKHGLVRGPDRMWYLNQGTLTTTGR